MPFLSFVELAERHDVWMVKNLKDLCFLQRLFFLTLAHICNVDLLNYTEVTVAFAFDQIGFAKGTLAKQLLFLVDLEEWSRLLLACVPAFDVAHHISISNFFLYF